MKNKIFATKLKDISKTLGCKSNLDFSKTINVPPSTLLANIKGERPPSIKTLMKIKKVMPGFKIDGFLG